MQLANESTEQTHTAAASLLLGYDALLLLLLLLAWSSIFFFYNVSFSFGIRYTAAEQPTALDSLLWLRLIN